MFISFSRFWKMFLIISLNELSDPFSFSVPSCAPLVHILVILMMVDKSRRSFSFFFTNWIISNGLSLGSLSFLLHLQVCFREQSCLGT